MTWLNRLAIAFFSVLGCGIVISGTHGVKAESVKTSAAPVASEELSAEYQKILQMVKAMNKPVLPIEGTLDITARPGVGPKDAKVVLVEFGDFQCPFCKRYFLGTAQEIHEKLVSTNQLRYVFMNFPLEEKHPLALKAAEAFHCAEEQEKYWDMRTTLYKNQKALHSDFLVEHATNIGLNRTDFVACLGSHKYESLIKTDLDIGKSLRIKGTPTFFIGINNGDEIALVRKITGIQNYEVFEKEINRAAEIAQKEKVDTHEAESLAAE